MKTVRAVKRSVNALMGMKNVQEIVSKNAKLTKFEMEVAVDVSVLKAMRILEEIAS